MDEEKLKNLVYQFWAAVIKARNAGDLDWDERFTNFPTACCRDASDLLAKFLYKNGFAKFRKRLCFGVKVHIKIPTLADTIVSNKGRYYGCGGRT